MAINFEAANMAGYNNPRIEVFRAALNPNDELVQYPSKTDILNCIKRGALPFILLFMPNGDAFITLPLAIITGDGGSASILFCISSKTGGEYTVSYPDTSDTPVYSYTEYANTI